MQQRLRRTGSSRRRNPRQVGPAQKQVGPAQKPVSRAKISRNERLEQVILKRLNQFEHWHNLLIGITTDSSKPCTRSKCSTNDADFAPIKIISSINLCFAWIFDSNRLSLLYSTSLCIFYWISALKNCLIQANRRLSHPFIHSWIFPHTRCHFAIVYQ